jgi:hypothetical protein
MKKHPLSRSIRAVHFNKDLAEWEIISLITKVVELIFGRMSSKCIFYLEEFKLLTFSY